MDHLIIDFEGDLSLDQVRDFLKGDDSPEARALTSRLLEDRGVSDMMIALADCLQEHVRNGIDNNKLREQIRSYADS